MDPFPPDEVLRNSLQDIDEDDDAEVSSWEAGFIDNVLFKQGRAVLTPKQRQAAAQIIERHGK